MFKGAYQIVLAVKSISAVLPAARSPRYANTNPTAKASRREAPVATATRICCRFLDRNSPHMVSIGIRTNSDKKFILFVIYDL